MSKPTKWALILCSAALVVYIVVCIVLSGGNKTTDELQVYINADAAAAKLSEPVK